MPRTGRRWGRRVLAALAFLCLVAIYPVRKAFELAAEPSRAKDCPSPFLDETASPPSVIPDAANLEWAQRRGTINDASCLNRTPIAGIVRIASVDDVGRALRYARDAGLKVSIAGVRHSMGGQAFAPGALVLDMTGFNRVQVDAHARVMTVQSGATWHDIQNVLHPRFAVRAMQSTDIFTVGGSIAVNAHGMDHRAGSVGRTTRAMRVMLADGSIRRVSRDSDSGLFGLVVGGYGLFGVILDVDLDIVPNVVYRSERSTLDYRALPATFASTIQADARAGLFYAHLSTAPQSFLREALVYVYREVDARDASMSQLGDVGHVKLRRLVFNAARLGSMGARFKWAAEKYLEPRFESCTVTRGRALAEMEACLVSRNDPMHDSVPYLRNDLRATTDVLQEYFIPPDRFAEFVDGARERLRGSSIVLLNASVRAVPGEDNLLTYAPGHRFAVVFYLSQSTDRQGSEAMARVTSELIDLSSRLGGRFFLPYQLHYSAAQLLRAYPEAPEFFRAKREIDPAGLFTSTFYRKYSEAQ